MRDIDHVYEMVTSHAEHPVSRVLGYTLVAQTLDEDGAIRSHTLAPREQAHAHTENLFARGQQLQLFSL